MDQHLIALRTLVAAGWRGTPLGNIREPDGLLYVRQAGDLADAVLVLGPDEAEAQRVVGGRVTWRYSGPVAEVVRAVLALPRLLIAG